MNIKRNILPILVVAMFLGIGVLRSFGYVMGANASSNFTKIHPSTYVIFFLTAINFSKIIKYFKLFPKIVFYGLALIVVTFMYLYIIGNLTAVSFILDTLLSPLLIFINFRLASEKQKTQGIRIAMGLILLNSLVAIGERIFSINVFPIITSYGSVFRSTALLGHPLNNALITTLFILYTLVANYSLNKKLTYVAIMITALICYGARGALFSTVLALLFLLILPVYFSSNKKFKRVNKFVFTGLIFILISGAMYVIFSTPLGERLVQVSVYDESSEVRASSIGVIDWNNMTQYLIGKSQREVDIISYNEGVEIIENFLVAWILKFGFIVAFLFVIFYTKFFVSNINVKNLISKVVVVSIFFMAAATNNSLSTNTQVLSFFVILFCLQKNNSTVLKN